MLDFDMKRTEGGSCCREFDPKRLDNKTHVWKNKLFLKDTVIQFLHIPLNMGAVVKRMFAVIEAGDAMPQDTDFLLLAYDPSPWKSELYMTVTKDLVDADVVRISGTFRSKVFDGPYNFVPKWMGEMDALLVKENKKAIKYYFHYAYCPGCAKTFGHNYCVAFAQIS